MPPAPSSSTSTTPITLTGHLLGATSTFDPQRHIPTTQCTINELKDLVMEAKTTNFSTDINAHSHEIKLYQLGDYKKGDAMGVKKRRGEKEKEARDKGIPSSYIEVRIN